MSRMESTVRAEASINDGPFFPAELTTGADVEMIRSETAVKPDPAWEHVDSHGHFHAFAEDGKTPTLATWLEQMPCDGSCGGVCEGEGYSEERWKCAICDEAVEPRFVPDEDARDTGIPVVNRTWATVTVHGEGMPPNAESGVVTLTATPAKVTIRVRIREREMVGVGLLGGMTATSGRLGSDLQWHLTVHGAPLLPRLADELPAAMVGG